MKQAKKLISLLCVLALTATLCCAAPLSVGAEDAPTPSDDYIGIQSFFSGSIWSSTFALRDLSDVYFDNLGTNLITDPTVANFNSDGTYPEYYDRTTGDTSAPVNADAWWDRPADPSNGFNTSLADYSKQYGSAAESGFVSSDDKISHTADGSGALHIVKTGTQGDNVKIQFLPLAPMENYSYYAISFWVKQATSNGNLNGSQNPNLWSHVEMNICKDISQSIKYIPNNNNSVLNMAQMWNLCNNNKWVQYVYVVYTGKYGSVSPVISLPGAPGFEYWFDDFGMYKLDDEYGADCIQEGYMLPMDMSAYSTDKTAAILSRDSSFNYVNGYESIDWSKYGRNIFPDSTVSRFEEQDDEKYYSEYYNGAYSQNVSDPLAMWDKPVDDYQASQGVSLYCSVNDREFVTSDTTKSHTNDGSGAVHITGSNVKAFVALPKLQKYSYYAVTFWMKNGGNKSFTTVKLNSYLYNNYITTGNTAEGVNNTTDGWHRVTFLVYTGSSANGTSNLYFEDCSELTIDELEVWKLNDVDFAKECLTNKRLIIVGDCNGDLKVTAVDLATLRKELLGIAASVKSVSDLNGDGTVNLLDLIRMKNNLSD